MSKRKSHGGEVHPRVWHTASTPNGRAGEHWQTCWGGSWRREQPPVPDITNSAAHRIISVPGHLPWSWCVGQRSVLIQARETWLLDNIQRRDCYHYLQGLVPRRACRLRASPPPTRWTAPGLCRSTAPSHAPHTPACTPAMQARRPSNPAIGLGPHVACLAQDVGVWPPEQ